MSTDSDTTAAYAHVETTKPRADAHHGFAPLWYGWALREAFLAGIKHAQCPWPASACTCPHAIGHDGPPEGAC